MHQISRSQALPELQVEFCQAFLQGSFVAPNPWMTAIGKQANSVEVCRVGFGISPINDRIYVDGLIVVEEYRRQGFASALLYAVAAHHHVAGQLLQITALHEVWSASAFWASLRDGRQHGLSVTSDLRGGEMEGERRRWQVALMTD